MLDRQEKMEIIRRLLITQDEEMTQEEMEQLLEEELAKPEAEIDTGLVQALLDLLEGEAPESALFTKQREDSWKRIEKKLPRRSWQVAVSWAARGAAAVALLIAVFFATYQTAEALNWRELLRWMQPLAEVFTLYSDSVPEEHLVQPKQTTETPTTSEGRQVYFDGPLESARQQITDYADAPERLHGYPVKAEGIPARFAYRQGSVFSDARMTVVEYVFTCGEEVCLFKVRIPTGDEQNPAVFQYERTINEVMEMYVGDLRVTYYFNADHRELSCSWKVGDVQYSMLGAVDQTEMAAIIDATMNR